MRSLTIPNLASFLVAVATLFFCVQAEKPLRLGLAERYAILSGSTVTSTGTVGTVVTGKIGVFPGYAVTGFRPAVLIGSIDSANGAAGGAKGALTAAYNALAGKAFNTTLSNQDLGGMTLFPGVYKFDAAAAMNGMLTLDARGDAGAMWTFQVGSSLLIAEGSSIIFKDSIGNPDFVYWQVGTSITLAKGVPMIGNMLALASITVNDGVTVMGRCLARNAAVTLDRSVVTAPSKKSFRAEQTVVGVSLPEESARQLSTGEDSLPLITLALMQAIAKTMPSITPANILNFQVSAPTASSILMNYEVEISSVLTAEDLQSQLTTAINNGKFVQYMKAVALANGFTDFEEAASETIKTETINIPEIDSADKDSLSDGAIAGIVIGCFFGVVLLAALVFFFTCHRGVSSSEAHKSNPVPTQDQESQL